MRLKSFFGVDLGFQQKAARHQVARGAALRAKADLLALHVGQGLDARVGLGNEHRLKLGVFLALGQGHNLAARAQVGLHMGEPAKPHQVDLLVHQGFHGGGVVADGGELHLHAQRFSR
jgi:hypothetical protein